MDCGSSQCSLVNWWKRFQVVAGNAGVGVVLGMARHVPVEEGGEWVEPYGPATEAELVALRLASHMHRIVHPHVIPAALGGQVTGDG